MRREARKVFSYGQLTEYSINGVAQPLDGSETLPKPEWPVLLSPMKLLGKESDTGLGDIIERVIGPLNSLSFQTWYLKTFGRPCACKARKEDWNRRYPLKS